MDSLRSIADRLNTRLARSGLQSLSAPERTFYFVWVFGSEIQHGGLPQFFVNASGANALETVEALERIGATGAARALTEAIQLLGPRATHPDPEVREAALDLIEEDPEARERLERLDDASLGAWEETLGLLRRYVE